jgi:4-amino-4-deoxy-L-arabinose transferase-like glycosyltransferase
MKQIENTPPEQEPTVLDLYKSVTKDWASFFNFIRSLWDAQRREELNQALAYESAHVVVEEPVAELPLAQTFPWRVMGAFFLACIAQYFLEPANRQTALAFPLYLGAMGMAVWAYTTNEWRLPTLPTTYQTQDPLYTKLIALLFSVILAGIGFFLFSDNLFTTWNLLAWGGSVLFLAYGLWIRTPKLPTQNNSKIISILAFVAVFCIAIFFRLYQLNEVPIEPFSDHAEKILDVYEISLGQTKIFFERNTGREPIQMYWTLLVANLFNTGYSFFSLKLGTVLLGILTLPFVYQLGKEFGNERVALFALFLFGIAAWPNIISRIGLRFPLYPLFVAPTLLYLIRGLRTRNRNDFILAGIFLGLGLHGYSPFRIMPFLVIAIFVIYFLHTKSVENRQQAIWWFLIVVIISAFVFSPLLRYWLENPDQFGYRAFTRLSSIETELSAPTWKIFLSNLYKGLLMFNVDDGEIWVHAVKHRPALDLISATLFLLGVVMLIMRYIRQRDWRDLILLVSIPILIMPSVLSLAYPAENPALNRAGGASVVALLISAMAAEGLVTSFGLGQKRKFIGYALVGVLFIASAFSNYDIAFNQFSNQYKSSAWNTSEMGAVIKQFGDEHGQTDTVWIVPFPHWVDTRLPGVWAGVPNRDFALFPERLAESLATPAPKMFIFWNADAETEKILKQLYPNGELSRYTSAFAGKDFYIFVVKE